MLPDFDANMLAFLLLQPHPNMPNVSLNRMAKQTHRAKKKHSFTSAGQTVLRKHTVLQS